VLLLLLARTLSASLMGGQRLPASLAQGQDGAEARFVGWSCAGGKSVGCVPLVCGGV